MFLLCLLAVVWAIKDSPFDLVPPLALGSALKYDFAGSAVVSKHRVLLTADAPGEQGYIYSNTIEPLPKKFMLDIGFQIYGESKNLFGDGMAVWLLRDTPPQPGRLMGLSEYYTGVCMAIDTYRNGKGGKVFPRLVLMQNDGTRPYDRDNDGKANEIASCGLRGLHNNRRQSTSYLRIAYSYDDEQLIVLANHNGDWSPCFTQNIKLGDIQTIALSAATGDLHEAHVVTKVDLSDLSHSTSSDVHFDRSVTLNNRFYQQVEERGIKEDFNDEVYQNIVKKQDSFFKRFLKFVFRLILGVGIVYAVLWSRKRFKRYQKQKEDLFYRL